MQINRRTFLHSAVSAAVTVAVVHNSNSIFGQRVVKEGFFPVPPEAYSDPLYSMTPSQFEGLIGQGFSATSTDGIVRTLILTEVNRHDRLGNATRGSYGESFSLIFENKRDQEMVAQDVYELSGSGLNSFTVLLVPTGRRQRQYEVVINRVTR